jgi:hypothetical protein
MNSIWKNLYDHFKDQCYGGIFILSLLLCTGLSVIVWKTLEFARNGLSSNAKTGGKMPPEPARLKCGWFSLPEFVTTTAAVKVR